MEQQRTRRELNQSRPDLSYLYELADGDENFITEVITMFMEDTPEVLKQSLVYLKTGNYTLLKVTVHKLKSSLKMLGNDELSDQAQELENYAQEPAKHPLINELLVPFIHSVNRFLDSLHTELEWRTSQPQAGANNA